MARVLMYGAYSPKVHLSVDENRRVTTTIADPPFEMEARTLGEALRIFDTAFGTRTEKYDGSDPAVPFANGVPKFFYHLGAFRGQQKKLLVDIHIDRRGARICPKQDLEFVLEDADLIRIGLLAC